MNKNSTNKPYGEIHKNWRKVFDYNIHNLDAAALKEKHECLSVYRIMEQIGWYINILTTHNISFTDTYNITAEINYILYNFINDKNSLFFFDEGCLYEKPILLDVNSSLFSSLDLDISLTEELFNTLKQIIICIYESTDNVLANFLNQYNYGINKIDLEQHFHLMKALFPYQIRYGIPRFLFSESLKNLCTIDDNICYRNNNDFIYVDLKNWGYLFWNSENSNDTSVSGKDNPLLDIKSMTNFTNFLKSKISKIKVNKEDGLHFLLSPMLTTRFHYKLAYTDSNFAITEYPNNSILKSPNFINSEFKESFVNCKIQTSFLKALTSSSISLLDSLINLSNSIMTNRYKKQIFIINIDKFYNDFIINLLILLSGNPGCILSFNSSSEIKFDYDYLLNLFNHKLNGLRTVVFITESANKATYNKITSIAAGEKISVTKDKLKINYVNNAVTIYINNADKVPVGLINSCNSKNVVPHVITFEDSMCEQAADLFKELVSDHNNQDFLIDEYKHNEQPLSQWRKDEKDKYKAMKIKGEEIFSGYNLDNDGCRQAWILYNQPDYQKWSGLSLILTLYKMSENLSSNTKVNKAPNTIKPSKINLIDDFISNFCIITGNIEGSKADRIYRETLYEDYVEYCKKYKAQPVGPNIFPKTLIKYCEKNYKNKVQYFSKHEYKKNAKAFWGINYHKDGFVNFLNNHEELIEDDNVKFHEYIESIFQTSMDKIGDIIEFIINDSK